MKLVTWNLNSINARIDHLTNFIKNDQADVYLVQELKCTNEKFPHKEIKNIGYHSSVNGQKAWNGVAFISKDPLKISHYKIPTFIKDEKLASRNVNTPKSLGPNPRAIIKPVASDNIAFNRFDIKENIARLVGVKNF